MKKTISLLLVLAMLIPSMAACSESTVNTETDAPSSNAATPGEDTSDVVMVDEETRPMHAIPESADYGGASFNIMYPNWQGYLYYFFADEATGDVMNDAIFNRTLKVEDYLNVDITQYNPGYIETIYPELKKSVTAADDSYQLALTHCIDGLANMMTDGLLYNYDDLTNVDYTADWWNREMMDVLRMGKNTYYGVSDYMIPCPYAIFFSKDLVEQYQLKNPYELVYNGEWTLDEYMNMATSVVTDTDGNGKITNADILGVCCEENSKYISFMTGADQFVTARGEDGKIKLAFNTEKTVSLVEKFAAFASIEGVFAADNSLKVTDGNLLFEHHTIANAVNYRDSEVNIGILPYPKYDTAQENYISLDWGGLMGVPCTIANPEMVGAVLELLAYESGNEVIPTYYDVLLDGKLARDTDTVAMLDILFDTIAYEVAGNYFGFDSTMGAMFYCIPRLAIGEKKTNFASWYKPMDRVAAKNLEKFYEKLDKVESGENE